MKRNILLWVLLATILFACEKHEPYPNQLQSDFRPTGEKHISEPDEDDPYSQEEPSQEDGPSSGGDSPTTPSEPTENPSENPPENPTGDPQGA